MVLSCCYDIYMVFNEIFNSWEERRDLVEILQNLLIMAREYCQD